MSKFGFAAINDGSKATLSGNSQVLDSLRLSKLVATGRVLSVVLDESHPRYKELGGPKAIGAVEIIDVAGGSADYSTTNQNQNYTVAYPLFPGTKNYPLVNEVIYLISQPSKKIQDKTTAFSLYYISVVNLWNHPHHNAIPYSAGSSIPQNSKNYQDTAAGSTNKLTDSSGTIKFGEYFKERQNINPLKPFEGDYIIEGRFSNTIRLGSTGGTSPWSSVGEQGSPIMILRNGQGETYPNAWQLITEDIDNDASSIYLTSNQKINLTPSSNNSYLSYGNSKPEQANTFTGNQIIISSGRLFFNSQNDHILLSSAKSINLNARSSINFDTTEDVVIQAGKVKLGSQLATEPVLLGDTTVVQLQEMLDILKDLLLAASTSANGGGPIVPLNDIARSLITRANTINLNQLKSTRTFTI
jgi:hypothetical protein